VEKEEDCPPTPGEGEIFDEDRGPGDGLCPTTGDHGSLAHQASACGQINPNIIVVGAKF
jgi:hypothetical protein